MQHAVLEIVVVVDVATGTAICDVIGCQGCRQAMSTVVL